MQNFILLASKLWEEFEVAEKRMTHYSQKSSIVKNLNFSTRFAHGGYIERNNSMLY